MTIYGILCTSSFPGFPPPPFLFHAKTEVSGEEVVTDMLVLHQDCQRLK